MNTESKLIDGKIPANTVCPFKEKCDPKGEFCGHMGVDHDTTYSCAFARGLNLHANMVNIPLHILVRSHVV